jgi:integrase
VILMAGWYGRLGIRLHASAHAPLRLHDLRHTAASLAIEACAHSKQIQALVDHHDVRPIQPPVVVAEHLVVVTP